MLRLGSIKCAIKGRLGELWWYTILLFVAQQFGAVINAFIGLWLVPKYVPQQELGAILPLAQVGTALTVPLSVLAITFSKYVNLFATQGEYGKVKVLLRDVFCLSGVVFLLVSFMRNFSCHWFYASTYWRGHAWNTSCHVWRYRGCWHLL